MIDFWVICVLLLHLLVMLLFFLPAVLIKGLEVFAALVLLHHFVPLELLVTFFIVILQILCSLDANTYKPLMETRFSWLDQNADWTKSQLTDLMSRSRSSTSNV